MARQYALPGSTGRPDRDDPRGLSAYIRETAQKYGIDPEIAIKVAKSEGLRSFRSGVRQKSGQEEPSWGAFQLYTGGGLGNEFQKATGLDPSDPANEKATIDYALRTAAKVGWGPWHGAKNTGIGEFEGIGRKTPEQTAAAAAGATPVSEGAPVVTKTGTDANTAPDASRTASGAAAGGLLDKLKDPTGTAATGLGEAISGLGKAVTGSSPGLYDTAPTRIMPVTAPVAPPPAGVVPTVDPRAVESQRQQLAMAMQRLNSGRLY
jgi:hypothetical protein